MLTQTGAIFLDAYRELNSKKMFWVVLILSLLVVAAFAAVGINQRGLTILWFEIPSIFRTSIVPKETFYKILFSAFGVSWWLNVIGIVLALVSTAGIFPDFLAGGSVDLYLSKPISRLRLFFTKYLSGLLFVTLQVSVFTAACFVLFGVRTGNWDLKLFLAVPLTVLVFSYLFCVCTLLGMLTRSTVAALLLTILFWLIIAGIHATETTFLMATTAGQIETQAYANQFAYSDKLLVQLNQRIASGDESAKTQLANATKQRHELDEKKRISDGPRRNFVTAHSIFHAAKTALPKTAETSALLHRWLNLEDSQLDEEKIQQREKHRAARTGTLWNAFQDRTEVRWDDPDVLRETAQTIESRPVSWVLGTSLLFQAAVLSLAAWIFCRRDF